MRRESPKSPDNGGDGNDNYGAGGELRECALPRSPKFVKGRRKGGRRYSKMLFRRRGGPFSTAGKQVGVPCFCLPSGRDKGRDRLEARQISFLVECTPQHTSWPSFDSAVGGQKKKRRKLKATLATESRSRRPQRWWEVKSSNIRP